MMIFILYIFVAYIFGLRLRKNGIFRLLDKRKHINGEISKNSFQKKSFENKFE